VTVPRVMVVIAIVIAAVTAMVTLPLQDLLQPGGLERLLQPVLSHPLLPLFVLATFWLASALFISIWLCIVQTALLFTPTTALPLCMMGALSSAVLFYGIGRVLAGEGLRGRLPPTLVAKVSGISMVGMIVIRLVPVLPFSLVNLSCGSMRVSFGRFVIGTVVGMLPGMVGVCVLGAQFVDMIKHPTPVTIAAFVMVVVAVIIMAWLLRRRSQRLRDAIDG
jgi:phospholipase D1/2